MAVNAVTIDGNGISIKSFREVREAVVKAYKNIYGDDLNLAPSAPDGQLIDLFCYAYQEIAEAIESVLAEMNLDTAEGSFLDNLGALIGNARIEGEDDDTYRARLLNYERTGTATFNGMLSYLQKYLGSGINLIENCEPKTDNNGITPHSVAVYISNSVSSTDEEIGALIWECKPAGIKTYGNTTVKIADEQGLKHDVNFTRINYTPYFMKITITEYDEEILPDDFTDQIATNVSEWANTEYTPGKDIIPQRVMTAVYKTPGINTITVQVSANGSTGWTSNKISIGVGVCVSFPIENIEVVKV